MGRKSEKGITLIALIITIIVMLILVIVTLNVALGDDGLINRSKKAARDHKIAEIKEIIEIAKANAYDLDFQNSFLSSIDTDDYNNLQIPILNLKTLLDDLNSQFADEIEKGEIEVELTSDLSRGINIDPTQLTAEQRAFWDRLCDPEEDVILLDDINKLNKFYKEHKDDRNSVTLEQLQAVVSENSLVTPTQEDLEEWQAAANQSAWNQFWSEIESSNLVLVLLALVNLQTTQVTVTYIDPPYDDIQFIIYINGDIGERSQDEASWVYEEDNGELTLTKYTGKKTSINVPSSINGKPVVAIDKYVLTGGAEPTTHTLALKDLEMDDSGTTYTLTKDNYQTFIGFANDQLGLSVSTDISFNEFKSIFKIKEIDGVYYFTMNENQEFVETKGPYSITISSAMTIKQYAFTNSFVKSVSLPEGVIVERDAFDGTLITSLSVPKDAVIGNSAFSGTNIKQLTIGQGARLERDSFRNIPIEKIDIPSGATINNNAFENCENLKVIRIAGDANCSPYAFYEDNNVEKIIIGEGQTLQPRVYTDVLDEVYVPASVVKYFITKYDDENYAENDIYMHYVYSSESNNTFTAYVVVPSEWTAANTADNKAKAEHMADELYGASATFIWSDESGYKNPPSSI